MQRDKPEALLQPEHSLQGSALPAKHESSLKARGCFPSPVERLEPAYFRHVPLYPTKALHNACADIFRININPASYAVMRDLA